MPALAAGSPAPTPTLREARAAVFAALCVLVGAVGHDAFSASAIPVWALAVGFLAVFLLAQQFTRHERGLPTILVLMGVVQVGLHELFGLAQRLSEDSMPMAMALPPRGAYWCGHSEPAGVTEAMRHAATTMPSSQHSMTAGMWAAHISAALVASWWLRRGEAAVWSLGRALALALIAPLVLLVTALVPWTPPQQCARLADSVPYRLGPGRLLRFTVARRGPPMTLAAAV